MPDSSRTHGNGRRRIIFWVLLGLCAVVLVGSVVSVFTTVRIFHVPSTSMENTVRPADTIVVVRTTQVYRGDVIVEQQPSFGPGYYIRRVIGLPGDHVVCCNARGQITVNGEPLDETYVYPGDPTSRVRFDVTVPGGEMWLMGDHRSVADDSQSEGPLAVRVVGRVFLILRSGHVLFLSIPRTFVADGLAPGGSQVPAALVAAAIGCLVFLLLLVALSIFGIVRHVRRRPGRPQAREPEMPQAVP
jgi:signal peptidase I